MFGISYTFLTQGDPSTCWYDNMIQGQAKFNDWVRGLMGMPGFGWDDVL